VLENQGRQGIREDPRKEENRGKKGGWTYIKEDKHINGDGHP